LEVIAGSWFLLDTILQERKKKKHNKNQVFKHLFPASVHIVKNATGVQSELAKTILLIQNQIPEAFTSVPV